MSAQPSNQPVNKIVVENSGIYAIAGNIADKISVNAQTNAVLNCYPDSVRSFWYKIYVAVDSRMTFEILPSDPGDRYNYFLYQQQGDLSIEEIKSANILPVRANLYNGRSTVGTGLSSASKVSITDSCPRNAGEIFYHTPYHTPVTARAGEVLMLNVYHLRGNDCGHHFILKSNNSSQEFHSIYERCYREEAVVKKNGYVLNLKPLFVRRPKPGNPLGLFLVKDSLRGTDLDAEIQCVKQRQETITGTYTEPKSCYETLLEKNTTYQITFSAMGYQQKTVSFSTKDSLESFSQEVPLNLLKEGDEFVMDKIYFYPNTIRIKPGSFAQIDQLASYLRMNPGIKIEIQGHTSGNKRIRKHYDKKTEEEMISDGRFRGSAKKLSRYRATLIKKYLVRNGISPERLSASGWGGSRMIVPDPKTQEEANRNIRVGILILSQEETPLPVSTSSK